MMRSSRARLAGVGFACTMSVMACNDGTSPPAQPERQLVVTGRAERGAVVHFDVEVGGSTPGSAVPARDSIVALVITPAAAATVAGDSALLVEAGPINVSATLADQTVLTTMVTVAPPPTLVFEGLNVASGRDIYKIALDGGDLVRLTANASDDIQPSLAGDVVVFTSYRDRNGEIYSIRLDGTGEQRLTSTAANETMPTLSPDGRSIAFAKDVSGVTKIWIASSDMSGAVALSPPAFSSPASVETSPAWKGSSDQLAFVATAGPSGRASLFTAAPTAGVVPTIVSGSGSTGPEFEPAWSPDGQQIAFALLVDGVTQIVTRDLRTSATTQLTSGATNCGQPEWLSDGRIVFVRFLTPTTQQLAWLDPAEPSLVHDIPIDGLAAQHPSGVRQ